MHIRKIALGIVSVASILLLTWCGSKKFTQVQFDSYSMNRYLNDKIYQQSPIATSGQQITIYQAQQQTTGVANSLIINKMPLTSGIALQDIVDLNMQEIATSLQKYKLHTQKRINVPCGKTQLTGYYVDFEYTMNADKPFYVSQYFFASSDTLYLISFHTSSDTDSSTLSQSIQTLSCK